MNSLQQQARFDDFAQEFNTERPHEALAMKCQAEIYSASSGPYSGLLQAGLDKVADLRK
jgi:putative transposase